MGLFSKDIDSLNEAFVNTLKATYYAEHEIAKALPKMIDKANAPMLKQGLEQHLRETEGQIAKLEQVFRQHGVEPDKMTCPAIDGILKAGSSTMRNTDDPAVLDAEIASAAQMVEHYEIAQYGTMIAWAKALGREDCASILADILAEEKATDMKLTQLAEGNLNDRAERRIA